MRSGGGTDPGHKYHLASSTPSAQMEGGMETGPGQKETSSDSGFYGDEQECRAGQVEGGLCWQRERHWSVTLCRETSQWVRTVPSLHSESETELPVTQKGLRRDER